MGLTRDDIVKRRARACTCRRTPVWAILRGGAVLLACPTPSCELGIVAKGHSFTGAVEAWNKEVAKHDTP